MSESVIDVVEADAAQDVIFEAEAERAKNELVGLIGDYLDGEAAASPDLCGIVLDEMRGEDGRLLAVRVVFCDMIGGNPARRLGIEQ